MKYSPEKVSILEAQLSNGESVVVQQRRPRGHVRHDATSGRTHVTWAMQPARAALLHGEEQNSVAIASRMSSTYTSQIMDE